MRSSSLFILLFVVGVDCKSSAKKGGAFCFEIRFDYSHSDLRTEFASCWDFEPIEM